MKLLFSICIWLSISYSLFSQCPVIDFSSPTNVCIQESFQIGNLSPPSITNSWDFCSGDLSKVPQAQTSIRLSAAVGRPGVDFAKDGNTWFGFVTGTFSNTIYRLEFANGTSDLPTLTENLGDLSGALSSPGQVRIVYEGNQWYGFVHNTASGELLKLTFGNSLSNSFTVSTIFSGLGYINSGFALSKDITNGWVCIISTPANQFKIIRLGNTFAEPGPSDILTSSTVPDPNNLGDVDLVNICGSWYGFADNFGNGNIYRLDFGSNLFSVPTITHLTTLTVTNPGRLRIAKEGDEYFVFVIALDGTLAKLEFGTDIISNPVVVSEGNIGNILQANTYGMALAKDNSEWTILGISQSNGQVYNIMYPNVCSAVPMVSNQQNPELKYTLSGDYKVSLESIYAQGTSSRTRQIMVSTLTAPDISFTSQNICANNDINLASQNTSGDITDYNWDFGDTNTSMLTNPTHQYASAGDYPVSLQVTATNGCNNLARDTITIYNQPIANFDLPNTGPAPFCTNQEYLFANTSTFDPGSNPTWQWEVNGSPVSADQDLNYTIPMATMQDVKLIAAIPGCETELMQTINTVEVGPSPDFTFNNDCEDTSILFTNTTAGATTGFSWDFGDGNSSLQFDPSNTFVDFGNYEVTLQATNAAGCINSVVKPIQIYSKPLTDFSIDLPPFSCSGTPSQFNDLTPNPTDSNLSGWAWTFGDPGNGTSSVRHAQYVYQQAGMYDVELEVTTNFGCKESIQKQITIAQSPGVDFQFEAACVGEATQFTDLSESSVTAWQWNINGTASSLQNPTYTFPAPTVYSASLTVTGSNNCIATVSKPVNVPAPPVLDFLVANNCATQTTLFSDNSQYGPDQPSTRSWLFEGSTQALGSSSGHIFAAVGNFPTQLTVTNQSGCEYTLTKSVQIVSPPVASFIANATEGGPPLEVKLTNQSLNAISQLWTVNGPVNISSSQISPTFVLEELGEYTIDLRALNDLGCSDVASKAISVIAPKLDVVLEELTLIQSGTSEVTILITLRNQSNYTVSNLTATVNAGGATLISEVISGAISPGEAYTQVLNTRIAGTKSTLDFVCVEIIAEGDVNPDNNKQCENLNAEMVTFSPYPNPSISEINFDWIAASSGSADVTIFNSNGQSVFQNSIPNFEEGLNSLSIQLPILNAGIYYIVFVSGNTRSSYPFMVQN